MGWTAGKWREWYPDVADDGSEGAATSKMDTQGDSFKLTTDRTKYMWQSGWWQQHQRLLQALSSQSEREGIMLSGDLHATGHVQITTSGEMELTRPVNSILTGPLGTGTVWPSATRGTPPLVASALAVNSLADVEEKNGFTLVDMTPNQIEVSLFRWRRGEPEERIDGLQAYHTYKVSRG
jgi:phosphodiesterase/alkaline phosphatase D-like protein